MNVETGFQDLTSAFWTFLTCKRSEKRALADMEQIIEEIWSSRVEQMQATYSKGDDNLTDLYELHSDLPEEVCLRCVVIVADL